MIDGEKSGLESGKRRNTGRKVDMESQTPRKQIGRKLDPQASEIGLRRLETRAFQTPTKGMVQGIGFRPPSRTMLAEALATDPRKRQGQCQSQQKRHRQYDRKSQMPEYVLGDWMK
ncbi:hypothetical protein BGX31_000392 [Mortierella sp. GBA43]|nr:hypothetical protein BGX31_000392 [Mortierella sp. GBA43]